MGTVPHDCSATNIHVDQYLTGCRETKVRAPSISACHGNFGTLTTFRPYALIVSARGDNPVIYPGGVTVYPLQTLTNNTPNVTIQLNFVDYDPFNLWDSTTYSATILERGLYMISYTFCVGIPDPLNFVIARAGVQVQRGSTYSNYDVDVESVDALPTVRFLSNNVLLNLLAGDIVTFQAGFANSGVPPTTLDIIATIDPNFATMGTTYASTASIYRL